MASLQLKNLKKIYPHSANTRKGTEKETNLQITDEGVVAVQEFNLDIADKEFVVLVGPSGCGKTTTLRMVAGLEEITAGELYIDGKLMNDVEPKDRDISMVFQSYALYPHMKVWENIGFPLKLRKVDKATIRRRVKEVAEILDISEYLDRKPKELSGGQKQRVAIGRAIVREPKVLLMDEPLSNLDAKLRNHMRTEIIKLRQKINTTFDIQLGLRKVFQKAGYTVMQLGTKKYSSLFGFDPLPKFILESGDSQQKVLDFNHYVYEKAKSDNADVVIIGIPGGIMPNNPYQFTEFGEPAFLIGNALKSDVSVLSLYCAPYPQETLQYLLNICKYRFGSPTHYISLACQDMMVSPETLEFQTLSIPLKRIKGDILSQVTCPDAEVFAAMDTESVNHVAEQILADLSENI